MEGQQVALDGAFMTFDADTVDLVDFMITTGNSGDLALGRRPRNVC